MKRTVVSLWLACALVVLLTMSVFAAAGGPVVLGTLMGLTGGLAPYGMPIQNATDLAALDINQQGGVLGGRSIVLAHRDSATNPQVGVDAANKLVNIDGATAIVGALGSQITLSAAQSVTVPNNVVMISPASTSPEITTLNDQDLLFRTVLSDSMQGVALAGLAHDLGYKSISVIYLNNAYGEGLYEKFAESYQAAGGTILGASAYDEGQSSYRGELQSVTRRGMPDALLVIGYVQQGGTTIMRQAIEGGFARRFLLPDGLKSPEVISALGAQVLEGTYGTAASDPATTFQDRYAEQYGSPPPQPYMAEAYDAVFLLAMAIEKAQSVAGPDIAAALRDVLAENGETVRAGEWEKARALIAAGKSISYLGASGPISFDEAGDRAGGSVEVWKITGGEILSEKLLEF